MVKKVGKYEIGRTLGEGTFGKVKYAVNSENGEKVAIKVLDKERIQKQNMGSQIKKEISIMKIVRHKHVVVLKEVLASRTKIFIVLELVTGGELFDKIVSEGRFDEDTARFYFRQLVDGVRYCHEQGVCHRDLKPENLLLDENGDLKISDFGLSALYEGGVEEEGSRANLLHTTCGTPNYVAPEILADKGYDGRAADTWSIGVILYVLLAGFLPFDEPTMSALFRKIQKAEFSYPSWFSPAVRALLNKILVANPKERITLEHIQQDPWYTAGGITLGSADKANELTRKMSVKPSQADMDAAIQEEENVEGEDMLATGPRILNGFELVNMCGGYALNRMFQTTEEKSVPRATKLVSDLPPEEIMSGIKKVLDEREFQMEFFDTKTLKVKATKETARGAVGVVIQLYVLSESPSLHLVELRRGKGDIMNFQKYHEDLCQALKQICCVEN